MRIDDASLDKLISDLNTVRVASGGGLPPNPPASNTGGGGKEVPMDARIAKLEAQMEGVQTGLEKLSHLPVDVATIKERLLHLPTKSEMKTDVDTAVDRAATRTQRTVAIVGGLVTAAVAAINLLIRAIP